MLTRSLDPRMFIAVCNIRTNARRPGLHNSFSSWPMMTASASSKTIASIPSLPHPLLFGTPGPPSGVPDGPATKFN